MSYVAAFTVLLSGEFFKNTELLVGNIQFSLPSFLGNWGCGAFGGDSRVKGISWSLPYRSVSRSYFIAKHFPREIPRFI